MGHIRFEIIDPEGRKKSATSIGLAMPGTGCPALADCQYENLFFQLFSLLNTSKVNCGASRFVQNTISQVHFFSNMKTKVCSLIK